MSDGFIVSGNDDEDEDAIKLPENFVELAIPAAEIYQNLSDKLYALAMKEAIENPNSKLGVKFMMEIVERKHAEMDAGLFNDDNSMFNDLNGISEEALGGINSGDITQADLIKDANGVWQVARETTDENGNPASIDIKDDNNNLYDPEAWDDIDVEMENLDDNEGN